MRVLMMLEQLAGAADWRGVAAQERAAMAVAAAVRTSMPNYASFVYSALGSAYQNLGSFSKALEHHKGHLTMAKEVGDRTGEGMAYGNLCNGYQSQGDRCQGHRVPHAVPGVCKGGGGPGGGGHGVRVVRQHVSVAGGLQQGHQVPHAAPGDCKRGGRPGGRGPGGSLTLAMATCT